MAVEYEETLEPMLFARPVGQTFEEMRENVRKTELYRRGDTVLIWVNQADLYPGPLIKRLRPKRGVKAESTPPDTLA